MNHFQFEQELASAVRMDTSIHIGGTKHNSSSSRTGRAGNVNRSNNSRMMIQTNTSGVLNRSQSESRLHPALSKSRNASPSRRRSKTPTRTSNSLLDLSAANSNGSSGRSTTPCRGDRFIPNRATTDMEYVQHALSKSRDDLQSSNENEVDAITDQLRRQKLSQMLHGNKADLNSTRILSFSNKAPAADEAHANDLKVLYSTGKSKAPTATKTRQVASKAEKVLDAPGLVDDFYLHLIDWSSHNHLAVALCSDLFVWNAVDGSISELQTARESDDDIICCVKWVNEGNILAVGGVDGGVELYNVSDSKLLRKMSGHQDRVAALSWNEFILASGCRDGSVHLHDVRIATHLTNELLSHTQEVCGVAWDPIGRYLATGANDNLVHLWDSRNCTAPVRTFSEHLSAIKAMAWCPWQHSTLATGGGTSDRTIKFWNVSMGECVKSVDCGSQVSSLLWNADYRELVSGHGFSHYQLMVWSYPKMTKVADLRGHTSRILKLSVSPDGSTVASAAADETIRLWKVWPQMNKKAKKATSTKDGLGQLHQQRLLR